MDFKKIESDIVPIYENETKDKLINARELHSALGSKQEFANWIKQRIIKYSFEEKEDFIRFDNFIKGDKKGYGNRTLIEYYLTIDTAKEICMIENNQIGRKIRKYFIETERRYKEIIENPTNIFDFMRLALDQIEQNENRITKVETEIDRIKSKIDVVIKSNYCFASDIAEQLQIYSENNLPHSNFISAIARRLGYKIAYKHYYEDEYIAIIKDISKSEYWQVYFKPIAVKEIIKWFNDNKEEIYYEIQYIRNTKNGKKGELKEKGYKIENICYKVSDIS